MGCMSSKALGPPEEEVINAKPVPQISWPTKCYRNPGVLPATLAIGYPYPYPDGYPNTPPPFPIPTNCSSPGFDNEKFTNCGSTHGMRRREGELRS